MLDVYIPQLSVNISSAVNRASAVEGLYTLVMDRVVHHSCIKMNSLQ